MQVNWYKKLDISKLPYRPGAKQTGDRFGLRTDNEGSLFHPGDDRSGSPRLFVMLLTGQIHWKKLPGSAFGSLLQIQPDISDDFEIQVAHTVRTDGLTSPLHKRYKQGQLLPVKTGTLGIAFGAHSHTECIIKYTHENYEFFAKQDTQRARRDSIDKSWLREHCDTCRMDYAESERHIKNQIQNWGIREIWDSFCIREVLPEYRAPRWGQGPVIIVDPKRWFDI
jgi:hypothetical protein